MSDPYGRRPAAARPRHRSPGTARRPSAPARRASSEFDRALSASASLPAPAGTTFGDLGLPAALVSALAARGVQVPFPIQARTVPDALAGRDVLGRAQTGSGKTLAFGLPTLARLAGTAARRGEKAPRALVLVPTRELARQVTEALAPLGQPMRVRVAAVYGGAAIGRQIDQLRRGVDVVVATPGRLIDLLDRGACTLRQVEITVIDEADHMADLGFLPAVTRILDATPAGGQRLLFSATLDGAVDRLVRAYLDDPAMHAVTAAAESVPTAEHRVFVLPAADKVAVAAEIAARPARTLFFVRTKHGADRLARQLSRAGVASAAIHGNLNQNQRERALAGFAAGDPHVLVATDVAARGIHIDDVDLVVHFDPPNDHKDYLHRSGRTARAGATGTVLAFVEPGQLPDVSRLHTAAGVSPTTDVVRAGDRAVRELATSSTPPRQDPLPRPTPAPAPAGRAGPRRGSRRRATAPAGPVRASAIG